MDKRTKDKARELVRTLGKVVGSEDEKKVSVLGIGLLSELKRERAMASIRTLYRVTGVLELERIQKALEEHGKDLETSKIIEAVNKGRSNQVHEKQKEEKPKSRKSKEESTEKPKGK